MTLALQTNLPGRLLVWLVDRRGRIVRRAEKKTTWHQSEYLLRLVDAAVKREGISMSRLRRLVVVRGPGPFSAVRTGLIVATTLGQLQHIPVRGVVTSGELPADVLAASGTSPIIKQWTTIIRPWYGRAPNITRRHSRARLARVPGNARLKKD